jgi:preprotein translocase subunit SecG
MLQTVLIVIHLMIVVALTGVVLLQRSEGGALGMGGGSGFMTGRGQANVLTRATAILAALFFATSLGLTLLANYSRSNRSLLEGVAPGPSAPASTLPPKGQGSVLDQLRKLEDQRANRPEAQGTTPVPQQSAAPAAPATSTPRTPAAPVEPTGMPTRPAAEAPSAPKTDASKTEVPATASPAPATGTPAGGK